MFARGASVEAVARSTGRKPSTVFGYLDEFVQAQRPDRVDAWVNDAIYKRVAEAAAVLAADRLKPIYEYLDETVPYEIIRVVVAHQRATVQ